MQSPSMQKMVAPGNVFYRLSNKDRPQEYDKSQSAIEKVNSSMRNENSFDYCNMYYGKINKVLDGQKITSERSEFDSVKANDYFVSSSSEISLVEQNNFFKEKAPKAGSVDDHEKNINNFFPDHGSCDIQCKTKLSDHLKHQVIECDSSLKHFKPENSFHLARYERSKYLSYSYQNKHYLVNESVESQNLCLKNDLQSLKWNPPHTYTSPVSDHLLKTFIFKLNFFQLVF